MTSDKTPWNPSRTATARVKNVLPAPTTCPYCSSDVRIAHHDEIYGRAYGQWPWAYLCEACDAYVRMHPFTNIPLGTLANVDLRLARKVAKLPFEKLWRPYTQYRSKEYASLAKHLGIPVEHCHFGWFDVETCRKAEEWALAQLDLRQGEKVVPRRGKPGSQRKLRW